MRTRKPLLLLNTFSLGMLEAPPFSTVEVYVSNVTLDTVREMLKQVEWESYVSHQSTATVLSGLLGFDVPFRKRENVVLRDGDRAIVFQILKRPKEGQVYSKEEIAEIVLRDLYKFYHVSVKLI